MHLPRKSSFSKQQILQELQRPNEDEISADEQPQESRQYNDEYPEDDGQHRDDELERNHAAMEGIGYYKCYAIGCISLSRCLVASLA